MNFNKHFYLEGKHATLSASQFSWIRYTEEQLDDKYFKLSAARLGSEMHELAKNMIRLGVRAEELPKSFNMYVNDVIGYRMTPEQVLFYSENCFGTADAIGYSQNLLQIFDLKTGENPTSFDQLLVYCAMFCLEYGIKPYDIEYDLRIYQNNEIKRYGTGDIDFSPATVIMIMDKIIHFDRRLNFLKAEEEGSR